MNMLSFVVRVTTDQLILGTYPRRVDHSHPTNDFRTEREGNLSSPIGRMHRGKKNNVASTKQKILISYWI